VKDPKVEVYVGIHDPNTDGTGAHGGAHAAPVFKRIVEDVLKHMNVPTDAKAL
jgi:cell division protein FtsI/penicillin-binding protein 2